MRSRHFTLGRFLAVVLILFAARTGSAQLPQAPPPHPSLEEATKEYVRLGLPQLPEGTELVRIRTRNFIEEADRQSGIPHVCNDLGVRLPVNLRAPTVIAGGGYLNFALGQSTYPDFWVDPREVSLVEPSPRALQETDPLDKLDYLIFAVQCRARGWDQLAAELYHRGWAAIRQNGEPIDLIEILREDAFEMWIQKLTDRDSNRKETLRRLEELLAKHERLRTSANRKLLKHLKATVQYKRTAKPGSAVALIDDLTDYWTASEDASTWTGVESYGKLVEMGFDAVPALIDHMDDERFSRSPSHIGSFPPSVGNLCRQILTTIAGDHIRFVQGVGAEQARQWFSEAKKLGEERWLVENEVVSVLAKKYPNRIPSIYQEMLKTPVAASNDYVGSLIASKLPRERKIALLLEGVATDHISHQLHALSGLRVMDKKLFVKHLLLTLGSIESRQIAGKNYFWDIPTESSTLIDFVVESNDPHCWDALAAIARRANFELRTSIISDVGYVVPPDKKDPAHRERIRFLLQFLDDREQEEETADFKTKMIEVRDYTTTQLAGLVGLPTVRAWTTIIHDRRAGPLSRLIWRAAVAKKAHEVLNRPKPPG